MRLLALTLLLTVVSNPLAAASFNCDKAQTKTEKAICGNQQLSDLDSQLGQLYAKLKKTLAKEQVNTLKTKQRQWLEQRDKDCGDDTLCLFNQYQQRLDELMHFSALSTATEKVYGIVITEKTPLNIREAMGTDTKIVHKAPKGSKLRILETVGAWYKVQTEEGQVGYASKEFIQIIEEQSAKDQPQVDLDPIATWEQQAQADGFEPLLKKKFIQNNQDKQILIYSRSDCEAHACGATLKGAVFVKPDNSWQLETAAEKMTEVGSYGQAPEAKLIQVGHDHYGVLFTGSEVHMGYTTDYAMLITSVEGALQPVLLVNTGQTNSGTCDNSSTELANCYHYQVDLKFVAGDHPQYYDIHATRKGTEADPQGHIVPVKETKVFTFMNDQYQPLN